MTSVERHSAIWAEDPKQHADETKLLDDEEITSLTSDTDAPSCSNDRGSYENNPRNRAIDANQGDKITYGTSPSGSGTKQVIFCVHGKQYSRCCSVIDNTKQMPPTDAVNGHCHRDRDASVDREARHKLIIASLLCVLFMIAEIVGGYLSNSLAIATDAAHLMTDLVSFMISLFSIWIANKPATRSMSFGWYRAEVIGALTSVLMIWLITGILVYIAILRVITNDFEIQVEIMLITSGLGVIVNIIMGCALHDFSGSGHHGHSHGPPRSHTNGTSRVEEGAIEDHGTAHHKHNKNRNINVRAAFIHVLGDFLQSFGVFVASLVLYFKPSWILIDPICTFLFSVLVMCTTFTIIRDALRVLMEASPKGIDFQEVCNTFLSLPDVMKVHNLHMWALSLDKTALAAHLAIKPGIPPQKILQDATRLIHDKYNFFEMTLQIEEFRDDMEDCHQCQIPDS